MQVAALTTRRAVVADAETMVRTSGLGFATWRAFAPADWSPPAVEHRVRMARYFLSRSDAFGLLAFVAGEPAGHCLMFRATWDEPYSVILGQLFVWLATPAAHARARRFYERRGWFADTLLEEHEGLPMAIYGLRLAP